MPTYARLKYEFDFKKGMTGTFWKTTWEGQTLHMSHLYWILCHGWDNFQHRPIEIINIWTRDSDALDNLEMTSDSNPNERVSHLGSFLNISTGTFSEIRHMTINNGFEVFLDTWWQNIG